MSMDRLDDEFDEVDTSPVEFEHMWSEGEPVLLANGTGPWQAVFVSTGGGVNSQWSAFRLHVANNPTPVLARP